MIYFYYSHYFIVTYTHSYHSPLIHHQPGNHINRLQFLRQQLVSIRNINSCEIRRVPASPTPMNSEFRHSVFLPNHPAIRSSQPRIHRRQQSTFPANMCRVFIRCIIQSLLTEIRSAMCYHHISLHFPHPKSAISTSPLCRLSSQIHHRTNCPTMLLVIHHMFQALVKHRSNKHTRLHLLPRHAIIHYLVSVTLISQFLQFLSNGLDS